MRRTFTFIPNDDPAQSLRVRRFLFGTISYLATYSLALLSWYYGYISDSALQIYTLLVLGVNITFYGLLRSGWNQHLADPSLTLAQISVGVGTGLFIMYFAHQARIIFGLMILPVFLFGVFRFRLRDFYMLAAITIVGYASLIGLLQINHPDEVDIKLSVMIGCAICLMFFQMSRLAGYIAHIRQKISDKNRELGRRNAELSDRSEQLQQAHTEIAQTLESLRVTQEELVRKEKMAALGALVAGVAHEINTPIGNSLLIVSLLAEQTLSLQTHFNNGSGIGKDSLSNYLSDTHQGCEILQKNLQRAADLVTSFKQVAADQTNSQRRSFDFTEFMGELKLMLALPANEVELVFDIADGIMMESYPGSLLQVINHLIQNALIHAFETHGKVTVQAKLHDANRVEIMVIDNGLGIPKENLPRIFDPFFSTKFGTGSSGLGLNITHNIVTEILGGRIHVTSEVGLGSQFTLTLPMRAPQRCATSQQLAG